MDRSYWLNRFRVSREEHGRLRFEDRLHSRRRTLPSAPFETLSGTALDIELFRRGFLDAALPAALRAVTDAPRDAHDALFWQFPCRTEGTAWDLHATLPEAAHRGSVIDVYLGLPWATWIDRRRADPEWQEPRRELMLQRVRLAGFRRVLDEFDVALRVHTVCQHVYWRDLIPVWQTLGVTDVWLSHAPASFHEPAAAGLRLHPWRLYAVNVEDAERRAGLRIGADPASKPLLASFVGAHADHYITDVRPRLRALADAPGFHVHVTGKWHFEDVVYEHQVHRQPLASTYRIDESVERYNTILSDSVFSLCPAGAGPNTLRLWESLAAGSVPVLLGPAPELPRGGTLEPIAWDDIVLRVPGDRLAELPALLRGMPLPEVRRRQQLGLQAFERVRQQRCFPAT